MVNQQTSPRRLTWMAVATAAVVVPVAVLNAGGCGGGTPTTRPTSTAQRQDAALRDPMNYKPQVGGDDTHGDVTHLDSPGLKKDLNDVFNP